MDSIIPESKGKRNGFKKIHKLFFRIRFALHPDTENPPAAAMCVNRRRALRAPLAHQSLAGGRAASVPAQDEGAPVLTVKPEAGRSRQRPGIPEISRAIRSAASFVSAGLPKEENRKYPSPHAPNPAPGVPTT